MLTMYIPPHFAAEDRAELVALMRAHPFATLITVGDDGAPNANHLPFMVTADGERLRLDAHVARANPAWRQLDRDVLVLFHGPHAYVSPSLYEHGPADARVPTWNYVAVHAAGRARILDAAAAEALLERLVAENEGPRAAPWPVDMKTPARQALLAAIVAFSVDVTRLEGKLKLSQNRAPGDRRRVQEAHAAGAHPDERELAALMGRR
jgi:transcriptional regulator